MASVVNKDYSLGNGNWAKLTLRLTQVSQSVANNTSQLKAELVWTKIMNDGQGTSIGGNSSTVFTAEGTPKTVSATNLGSSTKVIASHTFTISHNSDGAKTASVSVSYPMYGTIQGSYYGVIAINASIALDTIARASKLKSASFYGPLYLVAGDWINVDIEAATSQFTHDFELYDGNTKLITWAGVAGSTKWLQLTVNQVGQILDKMPNETTKTFILWMRTKSGSNAIGGWVSRNITAKVDARVKPTATSVSITDTSTTTLNTTAASLGIGLIAGVSKIQAKTEGVQPGRGATLKTWSWTWDEQVKTSTTSTSPIFGPVYKTRGMKVSVTVTDSRGMKSTFQSTSRTLIPYNPPKIENFVVRRYNPSDTKNINYDLGVTMPFDKLQGKNVLWYRIFQRKVTSSTDTQHLSWRGGTNGFNYDLTGSNAISASALSNIDDDGDYYITVEVQDLFSSVTRRVKLAGQRHLWRRLTRGRKAEYFLPDGLFLNGDEVKGVLIEDGYNSYGRWQKWSSGLLICEAYDTRDIIMDQAWGSMYGAEFGRLTWPHAFFRAPYATFSPYTGSSVFLTTSNNNTTTTSATLWCYRPISTSVAADVGINAIAIGVWK